MTRGEGACLICGKPIIYFEKAQKMECVMCHKKQETYASCEDGHFVCDDCHAAEGIRVIMKGCLETNSRNPIAIMQKLMENPYIYMHGPEHHVMVGLRFWLLFIIAEAFVNGAAERHMKRLLRRWRQEEGNIRADPAAFGDAAEQLSVRECL